MWRTCCHSPWMQTLSGVNAVATPTGAPTCPPWVALTASDARSPQCSGASPPGRSGPQASTSPPPVTRHPLGGGGAATQTCSSVPVTVCPVAPTTSHVTDTSSHALAVRPLTLPVADAVAPGSSDAMVAGVVGTGVPAPVGGQVGSLVKMLSVIAQFWRSAVPVFISVMSTSFVPSAARTLHTFVTASPGVRHWNFASSNAVACTSPGVGVQSHVTAALSGSAAESVAEQSALFAPDVNTHAPLTHAAWPLPQSTSATHAPASAPTLTVVGNPALPSVMEHVKRSAVPVLATT